MLELYPSVAARRINLPALNQTLPCSLVSKSMESDISLSLVTDLVVLFVIKVFNEFSFAIFCFERSQINENFLVTSFFCSAPAIEIAVGRGKKGDLMDYEGAKKAKYGKKGKLFFSKRNKTNIEPRLLMRA